jgi:predicted kinase
MPKLYIICGPSGSGKTTVAAGLAGKLNTSWLSKDAIKEQLYEVMGLSTLEDSKQLGHYSIALLLHLAEIQLKNGVDVIIEAPFNFVEDYETFRKWEEAHHTIIFSIVCTAPPSTLKQRFYDRPRHQAHHDNEREYTTQDESVYMHLPGKHIILDTQQTLNELLDHLIKQIQSTSNTKASGPL